MTEFFDIHLASDAERRQAHENCHDVWSLGLSLPDHVARRENSPLHCRARWVVGCLDGKVIAALASHPLQYLLHGRSLPGIGIASVHTLQAYRGQGFAQRMIRWIETFEQQEGARLSALFCDIEPRYYERLGYLLCPSHQGTVKTDPPPASGAFAAEYRLVPVTAGEAFAQRIPRLAALYDSDHGRRPLAIDRTADYWQHLAARQPSAEHFWLVDSAGADRGYVWLKTVETELRIEDHAVGDGEIGAREALFHLVIALAKGRGLAQVGGWLPAAPPATGLFDLAPRKDEITMVKPLDLSLTLDPAVLASADWWQEIDHV